MQVSAPTQDGIWIFGYGSIIWRPDFEFVDRKVGLVRHWKRRFFQGSTDHRGVPGAPGRVVTLLPEDRAVCWGVAFRVTGAEKARVLNELDHRERGGYQRSWEPFWERGHSDQPTPSHRVLVYRADETNPEFLGGASMPIMAQQIKDASGPSGTNSEYLLRLADSLVDLGIYDRHVADLAHMVRALRHAHRISA